MRIESNIHQATKADLAAITALLNQTNLPPDGIEPHLENFLIIRDSDSNKETQQIIGCAGLEIYGKSALLRSVAIHPAFQREGYGTTLVDRMIELARQKGITRLFLLTDTAEAYFKNKGFSLILREQVPDDMKESVEFKVLCTSSPVLMKKI